MKHAFTKFIMEPVLKLSQSQEFKFGLKNNIVRIPSLKFMDFFNQGDFTCF